MPKRCALGCPFISGRPHHQFPHPVRNLDRFKAWVWIVGGKLDSQDKIDLYRKKVICDIHFTKKDRNRNNRLNCLAVPSLHLHGKSDDVDSSDKGLPSKPVNKEGSCSMFRPTVTEKCTGVAALEHNDDPLRKKIRESLSDHKTSTQVLKSQAMLDPPSESNQYLTGLSDHETSTPVFDSEPILDLPSESNQYLTGLSDHETSTQVPESELTQGLPSTSYKTSTHVSPMSEMLDLPSPISKETFTYKCPDWVKHNNLKEHSYCARDKTDSTKAGESKYHRPISPLTVNQLQTARKKVKQLQSEVTRLRKRNKIVKTRLINAKKNCKHNCLQKITQNMTAAAKTFTHMQFTQTQKKNGGRRFTLEGQQLCHSIYNSSPQCYGLLTKLFTLPSAKTLKKYLRKQFDIQPGLDDGLDESPMQPCTF